MAHLPAKLIFLFIFLISNAAYAYPDFISYGYNTCISCHYNSHGYGPLTDYGRALFSQEIAARNFWTPKSKSDEEVAENSQFIPGVNLPFWIRPNIKYRGIYIQRNPGSANSTEMWIRMQRDFNLVLAADEAQRTVLVLNYGLTHDKQTFYYEFGKPVDAVTREHYIRFFPVKKLLVAAGLMDIAYGLRTGDHTSYARDPLGLGYDDQVHGVMGQWFEESWDATLHAYVGNLFEPENEQRVGASFMGEYLTGETNKVGFSFMQANSDVAKAQRFAVHNRYGISHGSSIIAEVGIRKDQTVASASPTANSSTQGLYGMVQSIIRLSRGYNLLTGVERYHRELKSTSPEQSKWTLGLLLFPIQRTEIRLNMVQVKSFFPEKVGSLPAAGPDSTQFQGQVHVSW